MLFLNKKIVRYAISSFCWLVSSLAFLYAKSTFFFLFLFCLSITFGFFTYFEFRKYKKDKIEFLKKVQQEKLIEEALTKDKESIESLNFFHHKQ
jgi:Ca2+-dependent lipid-binding protein